MNQWTDQPMNLPAGRQANQLFPTFDFLNMLYMENLRLNLNAPWAEVREMIKEMNIDLTDDDLDYEPGREEELLERLEMKLGRNKTQIKALIESISYNRGIAG